MKTYKISDQGYHNIQRSILNEIKSIFSTLNFKDKSIKSRIVELWAGLELQANFADSSKPYFINGSKVYLKRGQLAICKKTYAEDRKISISVFNRILSVLEENEYIKMNSLSGVKGHCIVTINNYGASKKISSESKKSKAPPKELYGPFLQPQDNTDGDDVSEVEKSSKNCKANLNNLKSPLSKELLNIKINKTINNKTTNTRENSSSKKMDSIISYFQKKLPKAQIHIDKFRNKLKYSSLSEKELLERIDIIVNSPVLTYQCKSINFIFTLENKSSIGYKKESEYLEVQKIEVNLLKTNEELQTKLNEMADYLDCTRETLGQYLISKGFDLTKPEKIEDEPLEIAEPIEPANNFLDLETFEVKKESPNKSEIPSDSKFKTFKKCSFEESTRKNMEKTLLNLAQKTPEKKEKIEQFFELLGLTGKISPALEKSYQNITAA